ncbi:MAG: DUF459 domain-containing protein, partial [Rhodoplanes sp.]|nr:DUF459 domain-containing protein [Rhodoplanes sp.]
MLAVGTATLVATLAGATPAAAQLFDDRFPFQNPFGNPYRRQQQPYQQQQQQQYWNPFQPQQEQRQAAPPADYSKAPAAKKPETPPTTNVLVFGDSLADWLAYGLEVSFTESPEMGVIRKHRTLSGLIRQDVRSDPRGEHPDWPKTIQETLATERPDFIVMMIGLNDRRPIREPRPARAAVTRPGQPAQPGQPATPGQP